MTPLATFKEFMNDPDGWEMFITGQAGTGKTTGLAELVQHCIDNDISYVVCAYTHKACGILSNKLPPSANISTLHSFLTKRPTINEHAKKIQHLESSQQHGTPDKYQVIFVDEYSMIGEADYADIGMQQDPEGEGDIALRVVYLGDSNQLPPVGDTAAIYPGGKYNCVLTKVYRQAGDNKLLDTLGTLVNLINGGELTSFEEHETFRRGYDLGVLYNKLEGTDRVCLAYTNKRVEELNAIIAGREYPKIADGVFSPTTKQQYSIVSFMNSYEVSEINLPFNNELLTFGSKYKTLEHLVKMQCCDFLVGVDEDEEERTLAYVFGHYQYKLKLEEYANAAVAINAEIEEATGEKAKVWCYKNNTTSMARRRQRAWRDYLTFKNCVCCVDFPYAMTVHKSQGSTYDTVLVDTNDLYQCAARDYTLYLKLMYVAISRASNKVYTT